MFGRVKESRASLNVSYMTKMQEGKHRRSLPLWYKQSTISSEWQNFFEKSVTWPFNLVIV